jgi:hypothetical protein
MSIADTVGIKIEGDASGAVRAAELSSEAVAIAAAYMKAKFAELGFGSKQSMEMVGASSKKAAVEVEESSTVIGRATERMQAHLEGVQGHYERLTGVMSHLNGIMLGALAVLAGGAAFEKAIEKTNELTAANLKLSKTFGISLAEASGMHAAMAKFGIETETVTGAVRKMDRQLKSHESALVDMGVKTRDNNGELRNQLDIFMSGLDALRNYSEGINRNLAAQAMFGRGVTDVAALLKLNRKELEEGAITARKLGLVTDQEGVESMKRYKVAINETKEVFEAIMVAIGKRVLPVLTELADYMKDNGAIMVERLGAALDILGGAFTAVGRVIEAFADIASALYHNALEPLLRTVDQVASALRDTMASAAAFLSRHLDEVRSVASALAGVLVTSLAAAAAYYATVMLGSAIPATITFARTLFTQVIPSLYAATTALVTGLIPALSAMAEMLALNIVRMIALDAVNPMVWIGVAVAGVAALAGGFAYWLGWLDPIIAKMKELWGWTSRFLGLDKAFKAITGAGTVPEAPHTTAPAPGIKSASDLIKGPKEKKGKADTSEQDELDALQKELAKEVKANSAAMDEMIEDRVKAADKAVRVEEIKQKGIEAARLDEVAADRAAADQQVATHRMTAQQRLEIERTFLAREYAIKKDALAKEIALEKSGPDDPLRLQTMLNQQDAIRRQHDAKMLANDRKIVAERASIYTTAAASLSASWGQALAKMATLQAGFASTLGSMWGGIVNMVETAIGRMLSTFLSSLITQGAAQAIANAKQRISESKMIYLSTVKAVSATGAPPPIPQIAGAAAFAGALAFSAERGYAVPQGVMAGGIDGRGGTMGIVHPGEMILDEPAANNLRDGKMGGDVHVHVTATDAEDVKRLFMNNKSALAAAIKAAIRDGVR